MEDAGGGRRQQETAASKAQRGAVAAGVSVHEWLQHVKASFLGLVSNGLASHGVGERTRRLGSRSRCVDHAGLVR